MAAAVRSTAVEKISPRPSGEQRHQPRIRPHDFDAPRELQVHGHRFPHGSQCVRERAPEPGRDLLGDAGSADDRPLLEHERAQAGLCEVIRRGETVVARPTMTTGAPSSRS